MIIVGFIAILIAAALIAPSFISADTYKAQIISAVESATGRKLTIDGKMSIKFFPVAGISAENVTLSNPAGFDDQKPFVSLSAVTVDVAVIPLLQKEIVVKNFTLKDPVINMRIASNGIKNWVFSTPDKVPASTASTPVNSLKPPAKPQTPATKSGLPGNFMLNNFDLKNGTVLYSNGASNMEVKKINASVVIQSSAASALIEGSADWNNKTVSIKIGIGTLKSLMASQKTEVNAKLTSDLFALSLDGSVDKGVFDGKESIKVSSIKDVANWLAPGKPLPTPAKLTLQTEGALHCAATSCDLSDVHLVLDALDAKGSVKVAWADPKPSIDINIATDMLDFNPFLPPQQKVELNNGVLISDALAEASEHWSSEPIDLSALNQLNASTNIQTGGIKFHNLTLGKTVLNAKLQQGVLVVNVPTTNLYKGTGTLSATVSANQTYEAHALLKSVDLAPLLKDMANNKNFSGIGDVQTVIKASGGSVKAIVSSLSGDGQIKVSNGEIKHVALLDMLHNNFGGGQSQNTVFTQMGGSFVIAQGVITNHDLTAQMQGMNVSGDGNVNLPAYTINYRVTPKLVTTAKDQTGASTTKEGLAVPVIIEGSLDAPKYRPDVASAVQNALKDPKQFKEQLKNSKGAVKNLKGLLQGL